MRSAPYPRLHRRASGAIFVVMSQRATQRPQGFVKPAHWSSDPPPEPKPPEKADEELSPTRYGDWVRNGIAVDF
jgi:hypothetical protein